MRIVQAQFSLNTGTGTQDLTVASSGTPIGVIFEFTSGTASGTLVQGSIMGMGAYDGTNARSSSAFSQNASTPADTGGRSSGTNVMEITLPTGTGIDAQIAAVGFITDGVQINITNAPATSLLVNTTFFHTDFTGESFAVTDLTTANTIGGTADTAISFTPNFAFSFTGLLGTTFNNLRIQRGFACTPDGTTTLQGNSSYFETDAADPTDCQQEVSETYIHTIANGGAAYAITQWHSTGVRVTTARANAATSIIFCLVKTLGKVWVGSPSIASNVSGDKDVTGPGFPADTVGCIATLLGAFDTAATDDTAGHISRGIGSFRGGTSQQVATFSADDGAASGATATWSGVESGAFIRVVDSAGADDWKATITAQLPTGFRINISNASASDYKVVLFAWSRPGAMVHRRRYFFRQSIRM